MVTFYAEEKVANFKKKKKDPTDNHINAKENDNTVNNSAMDQRLPSTPKDGKLCPRKPLTLTLCRVFFKHGLAFVQATPFH